MHRAVRSPLPGTHPPSPIRQGVLGDCARMLLRPTLTELIGGRVGGWVGGWVTLCFGWLILKPARQHTSPIGETPPAFDPDFGGLDLNSGKFSFDQI